MRSEPVTSLTFTSPRYTSYATASGPSGDRFHITCTLVALPAAAVTPAGADGGRLSVPLPSPLQAQDTVNNSAPQPDMTYLTARRTADPSSAHPARYWSGPIWTRRYVRIKRGASAPWAVVAAPDTDSGARPMSGVRGVHRTAP
ncbi:hypothetical protein GCM10009540_70280 [Streptomyces turgidiscabies]